MIKGARLNLKMVQLMEELKAKLKEGSLCRRQHQRLLNSVFDVLHKCVTFLVPKAKER